MFDGMNEVETEEGLLKAAALRTHAKTVADDGLCGSTRNAAASRAGISQWFYCQPW
jgi:hypothetical protein